MEGGDAPPPPSRAPSLCPATVPLRASTSLNGIVTDSNRPQPLRQPPRTACPTASGAASEVPFPSNASLPGGSPDKPKVRTAGESALGKYPEDMPRALIPTASTPTALNDAGHLRGCPRLCPIGPPFPRGPATARPPGHGPTRSYGAGAGHRYAHPHGAREWGRGRGGPASRCTEGGRRTVSGTEDRGLPRAVRRSSSARLPLPSRGRPAGGPEDAPQKSEDELSRKTG